MTEKETLSIELFGIIIGKASGWDDAYDGAMFFYDVEITKNIFNEEVPKGAGLFLSPYSGHFEYNLVVTESLDQEGNLQTTDHKLSLDFDKIKSLQRLT